MRHAFLGMIGMFWPFPNLQLLLPPRTTTNWLDMGFSWAYHKSSVLMFKAKSVWIRLITLQIVTFFMFSSLLKNPYQVFWSFLSISNICGEPLNLVGTKKVDFNKLDLTNEKLHNGLFKVMFSMSIWNPHSFASALQFQRLLVATFFLCWAPFSHNWLAQTVTLLHFVSKRKVGVGKSLLDIWPGLLGMCQSYIPMAIITKLCSRN